MGVIGISVVKNEADIIEAMVRHNLSYLDRLLIIDNGSSDRTVPILHLLADEGLPITISHNSELGHKQISILEKIINSESQNNNVILLDADEFLIAKSNAEIQELFSDHEKVYLLPWVTYVANPTDDQSEKNPILRIRHRKNREAPPVFQDSCAFLFSQTHNAYSR